MVYRRRISMLVAGSVIAAAVAPPAAGAAQEVTTTTTPASAPTPPGQATQPTAGATANAGAAPKGSRAPDPREPAHMSVKVHGIHKDHKLMVGKRARAAGYLRPYVAGEHVRVSLLRHGKVVRKLNPEVKKVHGADKGVFHFKSMPLIKPGTYKVLATHERTGSQRGVVARSKKFRIRYPDLDPGNRNSEVKVFNKVLSKQGYFTSHGKKYNVRTEWAVMAFRKVNGMKRTFNANAAIFKKLASGHGKYNLKYPGKGKHVEVDISKQVMVLAKKGKPQHTFAVSTGAPATPTIRGHFRFYRKDAGYNSVGMYYSIYFHNGYATHGYHSVPTYNASHGCVRNPIPDSVFIYNWISLGDSIYVYG